MKKHSTKNREYNKIEIVAKTMYLICVLEKNFYLWFYECTKRLLICVFDKDFICDLQNEC